MRTGSTGSVDSRLYNNNNNTSSNKADIFSMSANTITRNTSLTNIQHFQNQNPNYTFNMNTTLNSQNAENNKFASHSAQSVLYQPSSNSNSNLQQQQYTAFPHSDFKSNTFINMDNLINKNQFSSSSASATRSNAAHLTPLFDSTSSNSLGSNASKFSASNFNCNALFCVVLLYFACLFSHFHASLERTN